ncbi:MAG: HAMP domain-containing sensor histidine kinase, partial [Eubacteriales bacterium]|nr:HAMP domain-containing sensor histidine kinase [Eubacteriales bacterium]
MKNKEIDKAARKAAREARKAEMHQKAQAYKELTKTQAQEQKQAVRKKVKPEKPAKANRRHFLRAVQLMGLHIRKIFSNLRFSLTLRIAVHYSLQLLKTTFFMLLVVTAMFAVAQIPTVNSTMDALAAMAPADGDAYSSAQLVGLPLNGAYVLSEPLPEGIAGFGQALTLAFSQMQTTQGVQIQLYRNTVQGGIVAAFSLTYVLYVYSILFWTLLGCDIFRVITFLRGKHHLNNVVLKPISDMTEAAATLSANNLSNRINIAGTKNELKDLATVINSMLDRIERSYNSQKQFVSDASHELRTPIAVIQGYASMLERWGKTDKDVLDEGITAILQETASMKELVERLLFLARHDKKTLMLEMEIFDPAEIMSAVLRDARLLSAKHTFSLAPLEHC